MKHQGLLKNSKVHGFRRPLWLGKKMCHFCVDYRKLNVITEKDCYPLPRMDNILNYLTRNSWFTTLDFKNGYWQI